MSPEPKYLYRGHHLCPCRSGLVLRKCHGSNIRALFDGYSPALLCSDIINYLGDIDLKGNTEKHEALRSRLRKAIKIINKFVKGCDKE